jgi:hypothetical protein
MQMQIFYKQYRRENPAICCYSLPHNIIMIRTKNRQRQFRFR